MFKPLMETGSFLREHVFSHIPRRIRFRWPRFNFIALHYVYLILWTLIGSILIYPAGRLKYVDALFFASGAATQSGLNTVDVNKLLFYQQLVLMLVACVCNPIFINTFVVFVRLYWFEKRFQGIVAEARSKNRNTRSRTKSEAKEERDIGREEQGVNGRMITVMRDAEGHAKGRKCNLDGELDEKDASNLQTANHSASNSGSGRTATPEDKASSPEGMTEDSTAGNTNEDRSVFNQPFTRDIKFADDVNPPGPQKRMSELSNLDRMPPRRTAEQHIAFVENQRRPKTKGRLYIPGPRDFDRGDKPKRVDDEEGNLSLGPEMTNESGVRGKEQDEARQPADKVDPDVVGSEEHSGWRRHFHFNEEEEGFRGRVGSRVANIRRRITNQNDDDVPPSGLRSKNRTSTFRSFMTTRSQERTNDPMPYLSWTPTIGRNSAFVDLTEEQREELGGIEYRSLKTLAFILVLYFVGFHVLGMVCLLPWIIRSSYKGKVLEPVGVNATWWGFFTPASLFNDLGFTLTPDSMISFQDAVFPLLLGSFLIIIGNTGFPCMLRFVIWIAEKLVPYGSSVWEELRFLLDHPRRCFTLLFPSGATWWLFWVLVLLNGIDLIFFIILDIHDDTVTSLPAGYRVLDGLFQAASTRTAGFAVVNIAELHPAVQVSYLIMMYISVFPIAISMRRTNVYEEKSLGIWPGDSTEVEEGDQAQSYVGTHFRRQLSFDLWYIFLGFFFIAIIEGSRLENTNDYSFTLFSVLFEIVSAYGTVGLSLGYPNVNTSFSAQFRPLSKLIIIAMQIRGRHRGLPYALDRAILLPSENLHRKEAEDASRRARRNSGFSDREISRDGDGRNYSGGGVGGEGLTGVRTASTRRPSQATTAKDWIGGGGAGGAGGGGRGSAVDDEITPAPHQWIGRKPRTGSAAGLTKLLSGALSAGPTMGREREKHA
ncbi:cation transport protein-domain-containing protein [Phyllosticta citricarpa]|uniref:Potassium transport protein n=2 Tax=Phyllosticta TaxID=121621 RepID=A0ABR1MPK5_9PEZI